MADFSINNNQQNKSYNDSDIVYNYDYNSNFTDVEDVWDRAESILYVVTCIIICISIPLILVAIHGVYSLVRKDHVTPIFIINLLISDLIQLSCMIIEVSQLKDDLIEFIFNFIYYFSLMVSVGFMVCIALERYLVITQPLCYHLRRTIKISVMLCVVVWALPLVLFLPMIFKVNFQTIRIIFGVFLLVPLPLFMFFLGGTFKGLSAARSVSLDEKRRIVAVLVLVTLIYGLLFLPCIIWFFEEQEHTKNNIHLLFLSLAFIKLSPLADLFLYFFMKKGSVDRLLASLCFCRMDNDEHPTDYCFEKQTVGSLQLSLLKQL